jgi:hypothetical protein
MRIFGMKILDWQLGLVAGLVVVGLIWVPGVRAQMGMDGFEESEEQGVGGAEHGRSLDEVIGELELKYSVGSLAELCDRVTDEELEEVGDAWMGVMHPNESVHERMDEMMGGEGSESLRQAHINMALGYLGCAGGGMDRGMMGGGRESGMGNGWGMGMMAPFGQNLGGQGIPMTEVGAKLFWAINWLLVAGVMGALIRWLWNRGGKGGK